MDMNSNATTVAATPLDFKILSVEGSLQFSVSGKLLHDYSKKFMMSLMYIVNKGIDRIVVDLSTVTAIDHSNVTFIGKTADSLAKSDRKMAVIYPKDANVRVSVSKLKMEEFVSCFDNLHAAISFFDQKHIRAINDVVSSMYKGMNVILRTTPDTVFSSVVLNNFETTMWLSWPKNKDMNLIPVEEVLQVMFLKCDGIFQFDAAVHKKVLDPTPVLVIMKPQEVVQAEIRTFYRYDTRLVMQFKKFYDNKPPDDKMLVGVCTNLSAGGIQFESSTHLEQYDFVLLYLQLPGFSLNNMIGKIVRVIPLDSGKFSYGIKFTSIFEIDRLKIENYILEKMNLKGV